MTQHCVERDEDGFPSGWALEQPSYGFHRTFCRIVGRPALVGEYTRLSRQIRRKEAVRIANGTWRVMTDTGEAVAVLVRRGKSPLNLVLDWCSAPQAAPAETPAAETTPAAPAPGRLSLGSKSAAMLLEARLRGAGIAAGSSNARQ